MKIAICDDDKAILHMTKKTIEKMLETKYEVVIFDNAHDFLKYADDNRIEMAFVDIEMGKISGIDVVKKLQIIQPRCQVIYYTNYLQYATDVYETDHCWYLLKDQLEDKLPNIIRKVEENLIRQNEVFIIDDGEGASVIEMQNIKYIERSYKTTYIYCTSEVFETGKKLDDIYPQLNALFFVRCHKSFIVNFSYVKQYTRTMLELKSGENIPISRTYIATVRDAFINWGRTQK